MRMRKKLCLELPFHDSWGYARALAREAWDYAIGCDARQLPVWRDLELTFSVFLSARILRRGEPIQLIPYSRTASHMATRFSGGTSG
jgi:hypothetical protein